MYTQPRHKSDFLKTGIRPNKPVMLIKVNLPKVEDKNVRQTLIPCCKIQNGFERLSKINQAKPTRKLVVDLLSEKVEVKEERFLKEHYIMLKKVLNSENIIDTCTTNRIAIYMLSTVGDTGRNC